MPVQIFHTHHSCRLQSCGPQRPSVKLNSHTASPGSRSQVGSVRSRAVQCIEGSFADDKTMTGMTYNLQLCLPTVCLRRRSEDPNTNVASGDSTRGQRPPGRVICLKGVQPSLPAVCPWSSRPGPEMLNIPGARLRESSVR